LEQVFRVLRHPQHADCKGIHQRREPIVELAERFTISIRRLSNKMVG
jgi:hypothetical protein